MTNQLFPPPSGRPLRRQPAHAPQIKIFHPLGGVSASDQANEFAMKERFKNPNAPMPLLKPGPVDSVHVIYFIELPEIVSAPDIKASPNGWWPERIRKYVGNE